MPIDYKEYHPDWHAISRYIRFVRAENKCEECGAENYKPHPETGSTVVLTVSHQDHDKANNHTDNLKALCQRCHLRHDIGRHIENRKYGRNFRDRQLTLFLVVIIGFLLPSCSGRFAAFFDRNWQRWNYPAMCQYDPALPGAFEGGLKYGSIIGGYKNDTIPVYYRYTLKGWLVVKDHDKQPVTATDLLKQ